MYNTEKAGQYQWSSPDFIFSTTLQVHHQIYYFQIRHLDNHHQKNSRRHMASGFLQKTNRRREPSAHDIGFFLLKKTTLAFIRIHATLLCIFCSSLRNVSLIPSLLSHFAHNSPFVSHRTLLHIEWAFTCMGAQGAAQFFSNRCPQAAHLNFFGSERPFTF